MQAEGPANRIVRASTIMNNVKPAVIDNHLEFLLIENQQLEANREKLLDVNRFIRDKLEYEENLIKQLKQQLQSDFGMLLGL